MTTGKGEKCLRKTRKMGWGFLRGKKEKTEEERGGNI